MALIQEGNTGSLKVTPRVSTPAPFDAPRWLDNATPDVDFSQFFQQGSWKTPEATDTSGSLGLGSLGLNTDTGSMSLSNLSLGITPKASDWGTQFAPLPVYTQGRFDKAGLANAQSANQTSARSGGYGMSAYGFSGTTGQSWMRGKSPYGFQTPMWQALSRVNQAMQAAGLGRLRITDGFRSYQAQVTTKKKKGNLAATPGRSIHGLGLAADLDLSKQQLNWLYKNGAKYGLINLPSESWHWQLAPKLWTGTFDRRG